MRLLILGGLLLAQFVGTGLPITKDRRVTPAPVNCNVNKFPSPLCPGSISVDTPFGFFGATLYGGDFGLGEVGCPSVRHEIVVVGTGGAIGTGVIIDSWSQTVLTSASASPARNPTLTSAQHVGIGSPAVVDIYLRSWTPNDFSSKADYCTTFLI